MGHGKTSTYYLLTREQLQEGITKCFENVRELLNTSFTLTAGKSQYALGLYIIAVEEFGRALLLANCEPPDLNTKWCKVSRMLFKGGNAHKEKINMAYSLLLDSCKNVFATVIDHPSFGNKINTLKDRTGRYRNLSVPLPKGVRGNFLVPVPVGRDMLEDTFYVEWDRRNNKWRFVFTARADRLRAAIQDFQELLKETVEQHDTRTKARQDR